MKTTTLTPTRLRLILISVLVLLFAAGGVIFMYGYQNITAFSATAQVVAAQAQASNSSLQTLITTKRELEKDASAVSRASQLVSESKSYVYQDQIISDINKYANEAGVGITNITFTDTKTTAVTSPTTSANAASAPTGIKSETASVTLANPVDYYKMLNFIHFIEQSLFKMQISQIGLSRSGSNDGGSNTITSDVLTIEVYIR